MTIVPGRPAFVALDRSLSNGIVMSESENCIGSMSSVRCAGPDEPPTPQGALRQAFARPHSIALIV